MMGKNVRVAAGRPTAEREDLSLLAAPLLAGSYYEPVRRMR